MSTTTTEQLHQQIEQLIRAHVAAQRTAAISAVGRAFASATASPRARAPRADNKAWGRRRPPTEVAGLAERLYEAVRAHPGETMAVIAPHVGETPRALSRPMFQLKRAGRVRSAGQRHLARYFPMSKSA
jgi:hypothetical protein